MSVSVAKSRFIHFSSVAQYRHFLGGVSNIVELGKHLTWAAETAQLMQQTDAVREYGLILSNLPVKEYQLIGQYYLGWYAGYSGGEVSASLFENIFEQSKTYKAKSLITLGAFTGAKGNLEDELRYHQEALKYSDLATSIRILRAVAIVKSKEGFHKSAIRTLESVLPVLRFAQPPVYYNVLNSLAVELGEVGRVEEANNICKVVLASPYINAYPEWRETGQDLALRGYSSRSSVRVLQSFTVNLASLPKREPSATPVHSAIFGPAPVVSLKEWKEEKMVKEQNGDDDKDLDEMNDKDLFMEIMRVASQDFITSKKLRKMVDALKKIASEKD